MINTLYKLLTKVGITSNQDKVLHFLAGFLIAILGSAFFGGGYGFMIGASAAFLKECFDVYQAYKNGYLFKEALGKFDLLDFLATIAGALVGVILLGLVMA